MISNCDSHGTVLMNKMINLNIQTRVHQQVHGGGRQAAVGQEEAGESLVGYQALFNLESYRGNSESK